MSKQTVAVSLDQLEVVSRICEDTRKDFAFDKHAGTWSWFDRDEAQNVHAWHAGFESRWDAMLDAAEPYLDDDGGE